MALHRVADIADLPDGSRRTVEIAGRTIVVFNVEGRFYALADRCPHQGGPLSQGDQIGDLKADAPGRLSYCRRNMIVRCPWHHWEFDLETGRSRVDPARVRVKAYETVLGGACEDETVPAATTFATVEKAGTVYIVL